VFVLPFGDGTLIGTTDERFEGDPRDAVASDAELRYLVETVNALVPDARLTEADIAFRYSGVRPLPAVDSARTAAITRRHWLEEHAGAAWPLYSVIGGKLTTCRSLAEEGAATVLKRLGLPRKETSADRMLPGAEGFPRDDAECAELFARWARESGYAIEQLRAMWPLVGMELQAFLGESRNGESESVVGTDLPTAFVRWVIAREWVTRLEDLVERRLMLMYERRLSLATLEALARILEEERPSGRSVGEQVEAARERLRDFYGLRLATEGE
jgi:glycerol-3-phosphate dehydrogenase